MFFYSLTKIGSLKLSSFTSGGRFFTKYCDWQNNEYGLYVLLQITLKQTDDSDSDE